MTKLLEPILIDEPPFLPNEGKVTGEEKFLTPVFSLIASILARVSLGAAVFFIPFSYRFVLYELSIPEIYVDYTNGLLFVADIFLCATLVFWIVDLISRPRKLTLAPLAISIPLFGLLLVSLVSVFVSIVPKISLYHFSRLLILTVLFVYLLNELHDLKVILIPLAASTVIQSIISIIQVLKQKSIGLGLLGELLLDPAWSGVSIVYAQGVRTLRAYGLSDHPNILGGCLAFSLVLLVSWQIMKKRETDGLRIAVILIGMLGLLLTFSRSAWLAFISGLGAVSLILILTRRYREIIKLVNLGLASLIALIPFVVYFAPLLGVRLNQANAFQEVENETRAIEERAALNVAGNEIFVAHALTGVGVGTSPVAMKEQHPVFPYYYQPPHNTLLAAAAETGIFGALFYGLLIFTPWLLIIVRRKKIQFNPAFVAATGALLAVTVVGFFDYYTWLLAPGRFWQFLMWGAWGSFYGSSLKPENND